MTTHEAAADLAQLAAALRKAPDCPLNQHPRPLIRGEQLVGAALFWTYLRSLVTVSPRDVYRREDLLVLLDLLQRDADLFTPGAIEMIAATWEAHGC